MKPRYIYGAILGTLFLVIATIRLLHYLGLV